MLVKETKKFDFVEKKPESMINIFILIWMATGKGTYLDIDIYLCFHGVYNYSYN